MKKYLYAIIAVLSFVLVGSAAAQTNRDITLTWTAVGDNGFFGTAFMYDIRYGDSLTLIGWDSAIQISGEPLPKVSGSPESYTFSIPMIDGVKYFFAMKVADEVLNWSPLSNIVTRQFNDTIPPAAIIDLQ